MSARPNAVEITAEGLDRIPGSHEGDVFEVKLFSPSDGGEVAHVLDEHGSTWSLGVGDWRPAPNAVEIAAAPIEKRIELRGDGIDVRTHEDGRISLRLDEGTVDGFVSLSGTPAEIRAALARALAIVNAVDRAALELVLE